MTRQRRDPERLTIDQTVVFDYLHEKRPRHRLAVELFAGAHKGAVALSIAPQGHRLVAEGRLAEQIQRLFDDGIVRESRQLARVTPGTYTGPGLFPGQFVGFSDAWNHVISTWRTHEGRPPAEVDALHLETHLLEEADVFITDDRPLLVICRRLRDEHGFVLVAMGLDEYIAARA